MKLEKCLSYDDVLLVPQYSDIKTRKEVDLSSKLDDNLTFSLPVISSPMDTVTESYMAAAMFRHGGFGVVHRYNTIEEQVKLLQTLDKLEPSSIKAAAVGISGDYFERASELVNAGAQILCLDVAHGHHVMMKSALKALRQNFSVHLMAGNVATKEGFEDLAAWGANSVRCNIGGGSICSTRIQTGHGMPGLQTILDCADSPLAQDVKVIADGGLKNSGDIVKAIAAGADFVMVGSLLAGSIETPGSIIVAKDGSSHKIYRGMASKSAQNSWRNKTSSIEGVSTTVPFKGPVGDMLDELAVGIRSGLSYSGCRSITEFQSKAKFVIQTPAGQFESAAHILRR